MPNAKQNLGKAGGRPLSYDPNLVYKIISDGLASGLSLANLDAAYVKKKLCDEHGVKGTIRHEALEGLVEATHTEIVQAENQALLAALPGGISEAVNAAVAAAGRELLLVVARQRAASEALAEQKCDELRADKRNAFFRISELEEELKEVKRTNNRLSEERDNALANLEEDRENLRVAQADVERLSQGTGGVDQLLQALQKPKVRNDVRAALSDLFASDGAGPRSS